MISFTNVSVEYGSHAILNNISLQLKPGEFTFLLGQTGSGKSTLLRLISMELIPSRGTVSVGDFHSASITARQKARLRRSLGIVFQDYRLLEDRTVYDNVAFVLEVTGTPGKEIKKRVMRALGDVGLNHQRYRLPHELSGGEQQRVVIARAMVNAPDYILADEPTGSLDPATAKDIIALLEMINMRGTGILMATHNHELVRRHRGRVLHLEGGHLVERNAPES